MAEECAALWVTEVPASVVHRLEAACHVWEENVKGPLEEYCAFRTLNKFEEQTQWLQTGAADLTGSPAAFQALGDVLSSCLEEDIADTPLESDQGDIMNPLKYP